MVNAEEATPKSTPDPKARLQDALDRIQRQLEEHGGEGVAWLCVAIDSEREAGLGCVSNVQLSTACMLAEAFLGVEHPEGVHAVNMNLRGRIHELETVLAALTRGQS